MVFPPLAIVWLIMAIARKKKERALRDVERTDNKDPSSSSSVVSKNPEVTVAVTSSVGGPTTKRGLTPTETKTSLIIPDDEDDEQVDEDE
jgi:hypothetical protein